jgi:hypothetical protein
MGKNDTNAREMSGDRDRHVSRATGPVSVGASGTAAGVALGVMGWEDWSAVFTVAGALMLLWGLHRLGRLGADPPALHRTP